MDAPSRQELCLLSLCAHSSVVYLSMLINKPLHWATLLRQGHLSFRPHLGARQNLPSPQQMFPENKQKTSQPPAAQRSRKLLEVGRKAPINIPFKRKVWKLASPQHQEDSIYLSPLSPSHSFSCLQGMSVHSQKKVLLIVNPSQLWFWPPSYLLG